jgi:hypothetical protein
LFLIVEQVKDWNDAWRTEELRCAHMATGSRLKG